MTSDSMKIWPSCSNAGISPGVYCEERGRLQAPAGHSTEGRASCVAPRGEAMVPYAFIM